MGRAWNFFLGIPSILLCESTDEACLLALLLQNFLHSHRLDLDLGSVSVHIPHLSISSLWSPCKSLLLFPSQSLSDTFSHAIWVVPAEVQLSFCCLTHFASCWLLPNAAQALSLLVLLHCLASLFSGVGSWGELAIN